MARLDPIRPKEVNTSLLLNELSTRGRHQRREGQVREDSARMDLVHDGSHALGERRFETPGAGMEELREAVGDDVMLPLALLGHDGLDGSAESDLVALGASSNEVDEKVRACHRGSL